MEPGLPELRVKVPCDDAQDFHARLARHVAANGLRIPTERGLAVSSRVAVDLVFRDGTTERCEGVVAAHLMADGRSAVLVRLDGLDLVEDGAARPGDEPLGTPPARRPGLHAVQPPETPSLYPRPERGATDAEESAAAAGFPRPTIGGPFETSGEIAAAVGRSAGRAQRAALVLLALALAVAAGGYALVRHQGREAARRAAVSAHVRDAERLAAEGRYGGDGGAIAQLLAAKRLEPDDPDIDRRLADLADRLERLGARALQRNDLAVASIHLGAAQLAAPDRESIRAKLDVVARRAKKEAERRRRPAAKAAR